MRLIDIFGLAQESPWCSDDLNDRHTGHNNALECGDGGLCEVDGTDYSHESWKCCNDRKGRAKCPLNHPYMCNSKTCAGGTAYCCEVDCKDFGGNRTCRKS